MKVICKYKSIDTKIVQKINLENEHPRFYSLTENKEYVVLGLSYFTDSNLYAGYPVLEVKNDAGNMTSAPLYLFEVIDDTPSKYWHIKFYKERNSLRMWPKSFYQDYYHDDLSEGFPDIVNDFKQVCELLENE